LEHHRELKRRESINRLWTFYPNEGPYRRELYHKHLEFFAAGSKFDERCFMGGNRTGKTICGSYETTLHLTGEYPDWWEGVRFDFPIEAWAAGKTTETTRDIVQAKLFGDLIHEEGRKRFTGTGMIPLSHIGDLTWKPGLPDLCDIAKVKHVSGGWSKLGMKTYQQGRGSFEGTEKQWIWFDEEPDIECYEEARMRNMTVNGHTVVTFTPLEGMSEVVMSFLNIKPEEPMPTAEDFF
jgi:phage terminase large subunit-like protein